MYRECKKMPKSKGKGKGKQKGHCFKSQAQAANIIPDLEEEEEKDKVSPPIR